MRSVSSSRQCNSTIAINQQNCQDTEAKAWGTKEISSIFTILDPTTTPDIGLVEYKNPYSARNLTISEACLKINKKIKKNKIKKTSVWRAKEVVTNSSKNMTIIIRYSVSYTAQIQGGVIMSYEQRKIFMFKEFTTTQNGGNNSYPS